MGRLKSFMLLEGGDTITWERHGQIYEGTVQYLQSDMHSITGEAYVVSLMDGEVLKEHTVYPSEVRFDKMLQVRKTMDRLDTLMSGEDLND
jgi:hypothetical protein|tara:strand:+ start:104 stop:376 length:273 start_codon:yes stop_codon:yes gene_type:complete